MKVSGGDEHKNTSMHLILYYGLSNGQLLWINFTRIIFSYHHKENKKHRFIIQHTSNFGKLGISNLNILNGMAVHSSWGWHLAVSELVKKSTAKHISILNYSDCHLYYNIF